MKNGFAGLLLIFLMCASFEVLAQNARQEINEPESVQDKQTNIIYLFRHAEPVFPPYKEDPPNPPLNELGKDRAKKLAHVLGESGITHIFSTDFKRTRETVQPMADLLKLKTEIYDPYTLAEFASKLKQTHGRLAVAGHSNTTPQLVKLLGGEEGKPIDNYWEFDRLYIVFLEPDGTATTIQLRYGKSVEELKLIFKDK